MVGFGGANGDSTAVVAPELQHHPKEGVEALPRRMLEAVDFDHLTPDFGAF